MNVHYNLTGKTKIRSGNLSSLIFFVFFWIISCGSNDHRPAVVIWKDHKARAVSVSAYLKSGKRLDTIDQNLTVQLNKSGRAMLGEYQLIADSIVFTPVISFTPGQQYEILYKNKLLETFTIPLPDSTTAARLVSIYPSADTLPENLLKLYLGFSAPMREGEALSHISLLDKNGDTLKGIFLDLQPELWNPERNVLTVWFDPGRIKRELIPNLAFGNPLKKGERYTLVVSPDWKDAQGLHLQKKVTRGFVVKGRDSVSPDPSRWLLGLPLPGTLTPLRINFREPLDYFLAQEVVNILDEKGSVVAGSFRVTDGEKGLEFHPAEEWKGGKYKLRIGSQLEDQAGNNLNRLFEQDKDKPKLDKQYFEKEFSL